MVYVQHERREVHAHPDGQCYIRSRVRGHARLQRLVEFSGWLSRMVDRQTY